jgi:hypothetical protein
MTPAVAGATQAQARRATPRNLAADGSIRWILAVLFIVVLAAIELLIPGYAKSLGDKRIVRPMALPQPLKNL